VNTILSFGLLALSGTAALQAFGLTMLLGTALAWFAVPFFASNHESTHATSPTA
jgi:predicted exporter